MLFCVANNSDSVDSAAGILRTNVIYGNAVRMRNIGVIDRVLF